MSSLFRSRSPYARSTPQADAVSQEQMAVAKMNEESKYQDLVQKDQEKQQRQQEQLANEQAKAAKAQMAAAKRAGATAEVDQTGIEQLKRHEDGGIMFNPGFIDTPKADDTGNPLVTYRDTRGARHQIPLDQIERTTDPTGAPFNEFTVNGQRIRQPESTTKPLFKVNPATGERYSEALDPKTGTTIQTALGLDPRAANKAQIELRKQQYEQKKQAAKFEADTLQMERQTAATNFEPVNEQFRAAKSAASKFTKGKRYEQRADGLFQIDRINGEDFASPVGSNPQEVSKANSWLQQKQQADEALTAAKSAFDPEKQRLHALEVRHNELAAQALRDSQAHQTEIADMEEAGKAGISLRSPEWRQVLDIARKDLRYQQIMAAGEYADQSSDLANAIHNAILTHNRASPNYVENKKEPPLSIAQKVFRDLNDASPRENYVDPNAPVDRAAVTENAERRSITDSILQGITADKPRADAKDASAAREIAAKSLNVADPGNWSVAPSSMGDFDLFHVNSSGPVGRLDPDNKRILLFPDATIGEEGKAMMSKASQDGYPVYRLGGASPMTPQELRDYIGTAINTARSAPTEEAKVDALKQAGVTPDDIRDKMMSGRISVQDAKWLNQKLYGAVEHDNSAEGYERGFQEYLAQNPAARAMLAKGTPAQKEAVISQFANQRAAQSQSDTTLDRDQLMDRRFELQKRYNPESKVKQVADTIKGVFVPMAGMLAQAGAYVPMKAAQKLGYEADAIKLSDMQGADWWNNFGSFLRKMEAKQDVVSGVDELRQWAVRARPGEKPPQELADKLAGAVFDGYHQYTPEQAKDRDTSADTFNVNKDPALAGALQNYLQTSDPSALKQLTELMVTDAKTRKTLAEVSKYVERPRVATPSDVIQRGAPIGLKLKDGEAAMLLSLSKSLESAKDQKQVNAIMAQAGKILGTTTPEDTALAFHALTTEASTDPTSVKGMFLSGLSAGPQEMAMEVASSAIEAAVAVGTGGAATPEVLAERAARTGVKAAVRRAFSRTTTRILDKITEDSALLTAARGAVSRGRAKLGTALAKAEEDFAKAGIVQPKFGTPLTTGQKLRNVAVTAAKTGIAAAPTEGAEELVGSLGDNDPSLEGALEQAAMGALGGLLVGPSFLPLAYVGNKIDARKATTAMGEAKQKWADEFNANMAQAPGFKPMTPADFDVWQGLANNPTHEQASIEFAGALKAVNDAQAAQAAGAPKSPALLAAEAQLDAAKQNLAGISQVTFDAADELRAIPEAERPLYTGAAKALTGAREFTEAEAKALIGQSGANAIAFQQAETLPAEVQGPRNLKTLADLPDVTPVAPGVYRLPDGVQLDVPQPLMDTLAQAAPSMGQLMSTAQAAQPAVVSAVGGNAPTTTPVTTPKASKKAKVANPPAQTAPTNPGTSQQAPTDIVGQVNGKPLTRGEAVAALGKGVWQDEAGAVRVLKKELGITDAEATAILKGTYQQAAQPAAGNPTAKDFESFGQVTTEANGKVTVSTPDLGKFDALRAELKKRGIHITAAGSTGNSKGFTHSTSFNLPAQTSQPAKSTKPTKGTPTPTGAENIARRVIGEIAAKSPKLKALVSEAKKAPAYETGGMWMRADGTVAYHMPTLVSQLDGLDEKTTAQRVAALLDEEIRHAANMEAAKRLWKRGDANPLKLAFEDWRDAWYADIWDNHFTDEMRAKVEDAYGDTIPEEKWAKAMEGLRMLDQLRATGSITEAVLRALEAVLQTLREFLDAASPKVKAEIEAIKNLLQEFGYEQGGKVNEAKARKKVSKPKAKKAEAAKPAEQSQSQEAPVSTEGSYSSEGGAPPPPATNSTETPPAETSREQWQKTYAKFKRALSKAVKAKDYAEIIRQADAFQAHYEADGNGPFPDTWSDWERHKSEAEMQLARQGSATNPLVVPILKPVTPPRPAASEDADYLKAQEDTRAALGGLFSAPVRRSIPQLEVPEERFDAVRTAAKSIIAAKIRTPEAFAKFLDDTFPGGKARPYSEAIWDVMGVWDKSLRGTHDWSRIYGDIDQPLPEVQEPVSPEATISPEAKSEQGAAPASYLERVLDAAIKDGMGELTIPVPEKNQNRDDLQKAIEAIQARGLQASTDGKNILVRGFRELAPASAKEQGESKRDWTSLSDEELPPLDSDMMGYRWWRSEVASKALPNGSEIEKGALALELADAISEANNDPNLEGWQHAIVAKRVAAQMLVGERNDILAKAQTRALADEYSRWFMGGMFDGGSVSEAAYDANSAGRPLPEGFERKNGMIQAVPASAKEQDEQDESPFMRERNATIKASKEAGNVHLDAEKRYVENSRGREIYNVHDPKERGIIRTVSNQGEVVVHWSDKYSGEKNLATAKTEQRGRKKVDVLESWLMPTDLVDYVFADSSKPAPQAKADTPASGLITDEESARLDALTVNNKDRLDKLSGNQLSQLNKELLRQPSSAKRDAILATEHPDDLKAALDVVTKAKTDTPATAEAKVEEQVQVVAATEGQRDAKEIKKEIITKVEKAIKDIETGVNTSSEPMTFRIPGDGTFTLRHELGSLSEFIKRVKRISTKDSAAPEKVKEPKQEVTDYALEWGTEASFNTALDQLQEFVSANVEELQKNPDAIIPIERLTRYQDGRSRYTSSQKANTSYQPSLAAAVKAWQATQGSKMPTWAELRDWLGYRARQAGQSAGIEWTPEVETPAQKAAPAIEATAPTQAATRKPRAPKKPTLFERLQAYFVPGAIVDSYGGKDRVIALYPDGGIGQGGWSVEVVSVDKDGKDTPGARVRRHSTLPSEKDLQKAWENRPVVEDLTQTPSGIADFGQKLGGARKDKAATVNEELSDDEIAGKTLSEIWPKSEIASIEDDEMAAYATTLRSVIPTKPQKGYKLNAWVAKVKMVKELMRFAAEKGVPEMISMLRSTKYNLGGFADKVMLLQGVQREHWDRIGEVRNYPDAYRYGEGAGNMTKIPSPHAEAEVDDRRVRADNLDALLEAVVAKVSEGKAATKMQFEVRGRTGRWGINKKGDPLYRKLKVFEDSKEALAYIRSNHADLVAAWEGVKERDNVKETDLRRDTNRPRTAEDWRKGKDATPEMFTEAFGFRGVEFGNWVSQGKNAKERQGMMNEAYDALHDLASILDIPTKALSLDGQIGLGFGSRGQGWASAHYEPGNLVINLTKTRGAGSLAHELFHAFDHYFGRFRGVSIKNNAGVYITNEPETRYVNTKTGHSLSVKRWNEIKEGRGRINNEADWKLQEGVRPEVEEAFTALVKALDDSPMAKRASLNDKGKEGYWGSTIERAARSFENYVIFKMQQKGYQNDYLANVVSIEDFVRDPGRYPYLLDSEIEPVAKAFDDLFATIKTKETEKGIALYSAPAPTRAEAIVRNLTPKEQAGKLNPKERAALEEARASLEAPLASAPVRSAQDAEYLQAVEAGDMAKAQAMVDKAAKAADVTYVAKVPISRLSYGELPGVGEERKLRDGDAQPLIVERTGSGDTLALADGYHRLEGMILNGETEVTVIILNSEDSESVSGLGEQKEFRRIQREHDGESADPVTRDESGQVIPLSQRFNPQSDSILYSAPAPKPNRATQAMRDIIEGLPPPHREVLRDLLVNGMSIEDAATTHGISETAVGNILRRGEAIVRNLAGKEQAGKLNPKERAALEEARASLEAPLASAPVRSLRDAESALSNPDMSTGAVDGSQDAGDKALSDAFEGLFAAPSRRDFLRMLSGSLVAGQSAQAIESLNDAMKGAGTKLTTEEETKFQQWKAKYAPLDSGADYDLRGAFKEDVKPDGERGHFPDTYKLPNHPTFSKESKYSTPEHPGGEWGERNGRTTFTPSEWMASDPARMDELKKYFKEVEPDAELIMPKVVNQALRSAPAPVTQTDLPSAPVRSTMPIDRAKAIVRNLDKVQAKRALNPKEQADYDAAKRTLDAMPSDVLLESAPAPKKPDNKAAEVKKVLESMPPIWRDVLKDTWDGLKIEAIAKDRNLSVNAVGNILRMAQGRFRVLMDAQAKTLKPTVRVEGDAVKAADGRPDLAGSGNPLVAAVDQRRARPEEVTHAEMNDLAESLFAADPVAAEKLVVRWMDSGTTVLSTDGFPDSIKNIVAEASARQAAEMLMTAAAKLLVTDKSLNGGDTLQIARLIDLYRNTGTEQARALNMRQDPHATPEERAAMYVSEALLTPPQSMRNDIKRNPANKERILAQWAAQADKIKADLKAAGYDIEATFAALKREKTLAEKAVPTELKMPLARASGKTRKLVRAVLEGRSWKEAAESAGMTLDFARKAYNAFRDAINKTGQKAAEAQRDALLRSSPFTSSSRGMASDTGAAQNANEPSPGGLSVADAITVRKQPVSESHEFHTPEAVELWRLARAHNIPLMPSAVGAQENLQFSQAFGTEVGPLISKIQSQLWFLDNPQRIMGSASEHLLEGKEAIYNLLLRSSNNPSLAEILATEWLSEIAKLIPEPSQYFEPTKVYANNQSPGRLVDNDIRQTHESFVARGVQIVLSETAKQAANGRFSTNNLIDAVNPQSNDPEAGLDEFGGAVVAAAINDAAKRADQDLPALIAANTKAPTNDSQDGVSLFDEWLNPESTGAEDRALASAPAPNDFAAAIGLPEWEENANVDVAPVRTQVTEELKQERKRKKKGGEFSLQNPLAVADVLNKVSERKSGTFDKLSEFWRASILSGPQTHVVNFVSSSLYGGYEASLKKMGTGALADIARLFGMKPDAASLADLPAMMSATFPAIQEAWGHALRSWRAENRFFDAYARGEQFGDSKFKEESFQPALGGMVGKVMRSISFRAMTAADEFVKSFFTRIEAAAQARQIARNEGLSGKQMADRIAELSVPGSEAWVRALDHAHEVTFQGEIGKGHRIIDQLDGVAKLIERAKSGDFGALVKGASHFVFPFVATPLNIFKSGLTLSPMGSLLAIIDMARAYDQKRRGNADEAARIYNAARALDDLANQIVAWGALYALSSLVKPGDEPNDLPFVTGSMEWRSTAKGERELTYRTAPPQSIRIGDKWYSYRRLDPFASALAFIVDSLKAFQNDRPLDEEWAKVGVQVMNNMTDKTFLQGLSDLMNAVRDPERFGTQWATNIATGFVPNLIRQPIRSADDYIRDRDLPNDMPFYEALGRMIGYNIVPQYAPPKFDVWGNPADKKTGTGGPLTDTLYRLFSPIDQRDATKPDALDVALLRYNMSHDQDQFAMAAPRREIQRKVGSQTVKVSLNDQEFTDMVQQAGQAARRALGSSYDGQELDERQVKTIKAVIERYHDAFIEKAFRARMSQVTATN